MLPAEDDSPVATAAIQDREEGIDARMPQLARHHCEILVLRNDAHASYEEIARLWRCPAGP